MTKVTIQPGMSAAAGQSIAEHARALYDRPGCRVMAVVELEHEVRTEPGPHSDKTPSVTLKVTHLEIPHAEQEALIRDVQRSLFLQRTARWTFDDDGTLTLSDQTLKTAGGQLLAIDSAFLRASIRHWVTYGRRVLGTKLTLTDALNELETLVNGLDVAVHAAPAED